MRFKRAPSVLIVALLLSTVCFGQLPSSLCDAGKIALKDCGFLIRFEPLQAQTLTFQTSPWDRRSSDVENSAPGTEVETASRGDITAPGQKEGFHWRQAIKESLTFLIIEHAYVVHTDFNWVVSENGVPFNHYWRDYTQSLSEWTHSGWGDGDPNWFGYVGHPIQGALTGFIQIQNDPASEKLQFSRTKAYWWSRFKAALWNAAYSTQWNLGPLSEVTVEKYGTKVRPPWNQNGSFPCSRHCSTGVGQIDIVMTPLGGTGWLVGEDFLDSMIVRRVEGVTQNRFIIDTFRVALNPIRGGANGLHGKPLWYRASRDTQEINRVRDHKTPIAKGDTPQPQAPNHGDIFLGYSHMGAPHCEVNFSGAVVACDPLSARSASVTGWNVSVEKKYLRYFGAVADFGWQYGGVSQHNLLFGIRGGASIGRIGPFAEALFGAVHSQESLSSTSKSDTSFAEALGIGVNLRLIWRLVWRTQMDELKTGSSVFERRNLRLASGMAVRF